MNDPLVFIAKGTSEYPKIRGTNLVSKCGFLEVTCVIPKKVANMDDDTCTKVVKVVAPNIIK